MSGKGALEQQVKEQADMVRKLKAAKETKERVSKCPRHPVSVLRGHFLNYVAFKVHPLLTVGQVGPLSNTASGRALPSSKQLSFGT